MKAERTPRRSYRRLAASLFGALAVVAAPAAVAAGGGHHPAVASADWNETEEIVVALGDHHYEPEELTLKAGRPYRIVLRNVGAVSHDMVGGSFFGESVIALRMVSSSAGRIVADHINSVYVRAKHDIELWLVPLQEGEYSFFCSLPGHREDGMEGIVRIVR